MSSISSRASSSGSSNWPGSFATPPSSSSPATAGLFASATSARLRWVRCLMRSRQHSNRCALQQFIHHGAVTQARGDVVSAHDLSRSGALHRSHDHPPAPRRAADHPHVGDAPARRRRACQEVMTWLLVFQQWTVQSISRSNRAAAVRRSPCSRRAWCSRGMAGWSGYVSNSRTLTDSRNFSVFSPRPPSPASTGL